MGCARTLKDATYCQKTMKQLTLLGAQEPSKPTRQSALVILPPETLWEPIQEIRRRYDDGFGRWMPHITLLVPFWHPSELNETLLSSVLERFTPQTITLPKPCVFPPRWAKGRFWMYLKPEPREPLVRLWSALQEKFPGCYDPRKEFEPHLTIGQANTRTEANTFLSEQADWQPVSFVFKEVALVFREKDTFALSRTFPLGSGG